MGEKMSFALLLFSCQMMDYEITPIEKGNAVQAHEDLQGDDVGFSSYCGTIIDPGAEYSMDTSQILGKIWERPIECRNDDTGNCSFVPGYSNLRNSDLSIYEKSAHDITFSMNISYEDGINSGLFPLLGINIFRDSIVHMSAVRSYEAFVHDDDDLQAELDDFLDRYYNPMQEQAYVESVERFEVLTKEYYYWGDTTRYQDRDLVFFGDGFYYDSGLFSKSTLLHICIQPFTQGG